MQITVEWRREGRVSEMTCEISQSKERGDRDALQSESKNLNFISHERKRFSFQ